MHNMTVTIMGTPYTVETGDIGREELRENDAVCRIEDKAIILRHAREMSDNLASDAGVKRRYAHVIRHELVHAIARECGVQYGDDEALVDWVAHIAPIVMQLQGEVLKHEVANGPDNYN